MILKKSNKNSFQSENDNHIKCCICSEIVCNDLSFMTICNHSWCDKCNDNLNKHKISNCPICKKEFKNVLKNGQWKLEKINGIYLWKWEKGINDSVKKLRFKKFQEFASNIFLFSPRYSLV